MNRQVFGSMLAGAILAAAPVMAGTIFSMGDFPTAWPGIPNSDGFTFGTAGVNTGGNFGDPSSYGTLRANDFPNVSDTDGNPGNCLVGNNGGTGNVSVWVVLPGSDFAATQDVTFKFDYKYGLSGGTTGASFQVYGLKNDLANADDAKVSNTWETMTFAGGYTELVNVAVPTSDTFATFSQTASVTGGAYDAVFIRIRLAAGWPNNITNSALDNIAVSSVPEPATLGIAASAFGLLAVRRRRA